MGKHLAPTWVDLAQRDPDAARALSTIVVEELEQRRGGRDGGRDCFPADFQGQVWLRFEADVEVRADAIAIGPGRFVEIADGVPVAAGTTQCIERLLDGNDELDVEDEALPAGYSGPVEYRIGYVLRPATPGDP